MRVTPAFMVLEEIEFGAEVGTAIPWGQSDAIPTPAQRTVKILTEADLQGAHDRGYEAGYQAASLEFEVILSQREEETQDRLNAAQIEFSERFGAKLAEELNTAILEIKEELAREAAQSVLPFIDERLRDRAIADLAESIMEVTSRGHQGELRLQGPSALIGALQQRLPEGWMVTATVDEHVPELTARVDASVFRTQISNWVARIQEASL